MSILYKYMGFSLKMGKNSKICLFLTRQVNYPHTLPCRQPQTFVKVPLPFLSTNFMNGPQLFVCSFDFHSRRGGEGKHRVVGLLAPSYRCPCFEAQDQRATRTRSYDFRRHGGAQHSGLAGCFAMLFMALLRPLCNAHSSFHFPLSNTSLSTLVNH